MPSLSKFGALPARRRQGAERLPHRPGRLRQILHLLRRPLYARRRDLAGPSPRSSTRRKALVDAGAREITLLGQNVNAWRGEDGEGLDDLIRALDALPGLARIRYTTSHPERHDRGPDPRPCRGREADALPPPAGAVGQRPRPQGDEPQPHAPTPICASSSASAPRAPTSRISGDFIVGFPGETDAEFEETLRIVDGGELCPGFLVQIFAAARNAGGGDGRPGAARSDGRTPPAPAGPAQRPAARLQPGERRPAHRRCCSSAPGSKPGQLRRQVALAAVGPSRDRGARSATSSRSRSLSAGPNSLAGAHLLPVAA